MRLRLVSALLLALPLAAAHAESAPDAQAILANARMAQAGQQRCLQGHLRVQSTGAKLPFTLTLDSGLIRYEFADRAILLKLGENGSQLLEATGEGFRKVSPARYDQPVEGTDITYEDISLKFLYWPQAAVDGSDTVDALSCWKLHLQPGAQPSAYAALELWVSKRTGDFLAGEASDGAGRIVKRFKVISGQRDGQGGWMLKKMRIETLPPGVPASITYLEIDK